MDEGKEANPLGGLKAERKRLRTQLLPPRSFPFGRALGFYGGMLAVAVLWRQLWDGQWPWAAPGVDPWPWPQRLAAGLFAGGVGLCLSLLWVRFSARGARLSAELARIVGPMNFLVAWTLALASALGEELLFRGAIQPQLGWFWTSLLFGAVHFLPGPGLWVWMCYASVAGFALGALFEWTGDALAPVMAHMIINGVQLSRMGRLQRRGRVSPPPASDP